MAAAHFYGLPVPTNRIHHQGKHLCITNVLYASATALMIIVSVKVLDEANAEAEVGRDFGPGEKPIYSTLKDASPWSRELRPSILAGMSAAAEDDLNCARTAPPNPYHILHTASSHIVNWALNYCIRIRPLLCVSCSIFVS